MVRRRQARDSRALSWRYKTLRILTIKVVIDIEPRDKDNILDNDNLGEIFLGVILALTRLQQTKSTVH